MSRYDVSFHSTIEADSYEQACKRAQQVALRASQLNKEIGGWFCGMDWDGDADDADPGVAETHEEHWPGGTVGESDVPRFNAANVEHVEQSNAHQAFRRQAELDPEGTEAPDTSDPCRACGADLTFEEHEAECTFYSHGGEDGRDG